MSTESVVNHHLEAVMAGDIDGILSDYADDAVFFHQQGTAKGPGEIRSFVESMVEAMASLMPNFEMITQDADGEVMYIVWKSGDAVPMGTDTFVVKDGKIVTQTFAAYMPA